MGHPRFLIPLTRRLWLALALVVLLATLAIAPAQAQSESLSKGVWRRALLSQDGRSTSYRLSVDEPARVGVVSLSAPVEVDITATDGAPDPNCGVAGEPRFFQNIACDSSNGSYEIRLRLDDSYSGDAVAVFVRFDNRSDLSFTAITASGGPYNFTIDANSVRVFSFNYSSGPSRQCVSFGEDDGLSHAFSTRRGALVAYNRPGDAGENERPSYRLETGNSPHYLIVSNRSGSGISTSLNFFGRTSSRKC